jgi:hypothetical protein
MRAEIMNSDSALEWLFAGSFRNETGDIPVWEEAAIKVCAGPRVSDIHPHTRWGHGQLKVIRPRSAVP